MVQRKFVATEQELRSAYGELKSTIKVAERFGVSKKLIMTYMKRFGIEKIKRPAAQELKDQVERLALEGLNGVQISEQIGRTASRVYQLAQQFGIEITDNFHRGEIRTHNGYRMILRPEHSEADSKGYVREHRIVMEEKLGRPLRKNELVHHINGDKLDNRPENLEVMTKAEHVSLHHAGKDGRGADRKPRKRTLKR